MYKVKQGLVSSNIVDIFSVKSSKYHLTNMDFHLPRFNSVRYGQHFTSYFGPYTAVSRKVVGKSARDNPERYCGWFCLPCSPKKFERMAREATDISSRVLIESNKTRFDSYSRSKQCIDHIPYYLSGLSRAHFSRQPFSK